MAVSTQGYDSQVSPGGLDTAPVQASPDAFGARLGANVKDFGDILEQNKLQQQTTAAGLRAAGARLAITKGVADLRQTMGPDDPGYSDAVSSLIDSHQDDVLGPITDKRVLNSQLGQWTEFGDQMKGEAYSTQLVAQQAGAVKNIMSQANVASQRLALDPSNKQAWGDEILAGEHSIETMQAPPDIKDQARHEFYSTVTVPRFQSWIQSDPKAAKAELENGGYTQYMSAEQLPHLLKSADVAIDANAAKDRALANQQREQGIKATDLTAAGYRDGRATYDQWTAVAGQYDALNEPEKALAARGEATQIGATEANRGDTPAQRQQLIDELAAKPQLTPQEGETLKGLKGQQTYVNGLPTLSRYTYATGKAVTPLDPNDPASIASRVAVFSAAQQHFGGAEPLLPDEAKPWQDIAQHGTPSEQLQLGQWINQWGPAGASVLRQVNPDQNSALSQAVMMGTYSPATMSQAINGRAAKTAMGGDAKLFHVDPAQLPVALKSVGLSPGNMTTEQMAAAVTPDALANLGARSALEGRGPQYAAGVRENADAIYASEAQAHAWTTFHPGVYLRSYTKAAGGSSQDASGAWRGGLGTYAGHPVQLPATMTQNDFQSRLSRAGPEDFAAMAHAASPGQGAPMYANGRGVTTGELKAARPVSVGPTQYKFMIGNGAVLAKDGKPYVIDVIGPPRK